MNQKTLTSQAAALKEIHDDIAAFDKECEADEYTDVGDAWSLFGDISNICERELKNIIDEEQSGSPSVGESASR